jgi:hypothetical protein
MTSKQLVLKCGATIVGSELIGEKLTGIVAEFLSARAKVGFCPNVKLVFRNDGNPAAAFGIAYVNANAAAINLQHCWDDVIMIAKSGEFDLSMTAALWSNIIAAVMHEISHIEGAVADREMYDLLVKDGLEELEEMANDFAKEHVLEMAREFDVEPVKPTEMGWFSGLFQELFTGKLKDEAWVIKARKQLENGTIYHDEKEGIVIKTWREYLKQAHDTDNKHTEDWAQPTTAVNLLQHISDGETEVITNAMPVAEAKTELADDAEEITELAEMLAAVEQAAGEVQMTNINGMFMMAGGNEDSYEPQMDGPEETAEETQLMTGDAVLYGTQDAATPVQPTITPQPTVAAQEFAGCTVPLQPHIEAQNAQFAAAMATANPTPQPTPTTYAPNNLAPEIIQETIKQVYLRLYHAIFTKCGWTQNPQTGRFFFSNPGAVLNGVDISDIIRYFGAANLVMEYNTLNAQGIGPVAESAANGMVRGTIFKNSGLPGFELFLNINGRRIKRVFVPQNPEKRNAQNAYSNTAVEAQSGHYLAWIIDGDAAQNADFKAKFKVKIRDNNYEVL